MQSIASRRLSDLHAQFSTVQWMIDAYALTLARANHYLKSPKHSREIMPDFKKDWALMEAAQINSSTATAADNTSLPGNARATGISFSQLP